MTRNASNSWVCAVVLFHDRFPNRSHLPMTDVEIQQLGTHAHFIFGGWGSTGLSVGSPVLTIDCLHSDSRVNA